MKSSDFLLDVGFAPLLKNHLLEELNGLADAAYGVETDFRLGFANRAWFDFASQNGGEPHISSDWGLGICILDAMATEIQEFYRAALSDCLHTGEVWENRYECSSHELFREFHQTVYPLEHQGWLITNTKVVERPHDAEAAPDKNINLADYRNEHGIIAQCAHCRRVKNHRVDGRWDWVRAWVEKSPANTSHGLCPPCFGHYYPQ